MIENEGVRSNEALNCLLCGEKGVTLYSDLRDCLFSAPGKWELKQCPKCQLVWLNPQPIPEDVGDLYLQYFTHQMLDTRKRPLTGLRKNVAAYILRSNFGYQVDSPNGILGSIISRIGSIRETTESNVMWLKACDNGRLLDIGSGNGSFLAKMKKLGWDVTGVEPDKEAVSVSLEKYGLNVFQGTLDEAKFPDDYFNAITLNHVIEHVLDPVGLLKECRRVLKPGGELIVVTPNINSLGQYVFGKYWRGYEVPRHFFLFLPKTLKACAEQSGLIVKELKTSASIARWMWNASRIIKRDGKLPGDSPELQGLFPRFEGLVFQIIEYQLNCRRDVGEEVALVATK